MPELLPRFYKRSLEALDRQAVARAVAESGEAAPAQSAAGATAAGDARRLRGVPCIARGVQGAVAGSQPFGALVAKERQRSSER